jgi:amino acid transporter
MTRNGNIPAWLGRLNRRYMIPRFAMVADLVLAMVLVFFFRDWSKLATVVSVSTFVAYATGPVTAVSLRKMRPNFTRPFNSKALSWVAPLSFVLTSMVIYWAMWPTTVEVIFVVVLGLPIYAYYQVKYDPRAAPDATEGVLMDALLPGRPVGAFLRREQGLWRDRFDRVPV